VGAGAIDSGVLETGRYQIVRRIGRGGSADVFEAIAVGGGSFARRVAIKRLLPGHAAELAAMFLDEARITSQLHHAGIVGVFDYGEVDGLAFQVLDIVDGANAGRLLQLARVAGAAMPIEVALHVCTEIAHSLAYAHDAVDARGLPLGIVHRDIKPSNILVSWTGDVRLGDFGVALAAERSYHTRGGVARGTPLYMAPEQAIRAAIDGRADVFSLGCVLHELVCGESPLADSDRLVALIAGVELEPSRALPDDVRAIAQRALRRDRDARYADAAALADALGRALARRLERDARSVMRAWLAAVRPAVEEARGRFDDLIGLELVLTGVDHDVRQFATLSR
jgi:serine/threonine-protein kinase